MEQRKIITLGQSSRVITLPKIWLKRNNLDQGDSVSLYINHDGSMVVHPSADFLMKERKINIHVKKGESSDSIIRKIIASSLNGYTPIELKAEKIFTVSQQKAIRQIVSALYMMIIESKANNIILESLVDESKVQISAGIQRIHIISYSMCQDIIRSLKNWDLELARSVISLEDDVDQLTFFLLRIIRSAAINPSLANQMGIDTLDCLDYQTLIQRIEHIADHATNIANSVIALIENDIRIPENVVTNFIRAAEIAFTSYDIAVKCYLSKSIEPTNEIIDKQNEIKKLYLEVTPFPHYKDLKKASMLSHLILIRESIIRISHNAADIAELTIGRAYKSP